MVLLLTNFRLLVFLLLLQASSSSMSRFHATHGETARSLDAVSRILHVRNSEYASTIPQAALAFAWAAGSAREGLASTTFAIGIRKAGFGGSHAYPRGEDGSNPGTYGRVIAKLVPKYLSAMCDMALFREPSFNSDHSDEGDASPSFFPQVRRTLRDETSCWPRILLTSCLGTLGSQGL